MGMTDAENANRGSSKSSSSKSSSSKSSSGSSSGYSPQSERAPSKSSSGKSQPSSGTSRGLGSSNSSNSDGRGSQREQVKSAQQAKTSSSNSDGRGSQREQRTSALASRVGDALSSIGASITGGLRSATNPGIDRAIGGLASAFGLADPVNNFKSVIEAGAGYTVVQLADGTVVRRQGARNWRNNNPGNIEYGEFAKKTGAIGTDGRFAVYDSYEAGRKAKESLLFEGKNYKDKTLAEAISRYAPSFENDTKGYTSTVAKDIGVSPNTRLSDLSPAQRTAMLDSMERVEGFKPGKESPYEAGKKSFNNSAATTVAYTGGVSRITDALSSAFDELLGSKNAFAGEMPEESQPLNGYRDPMVSTPDGRKARGEPEPGPASQPKATRRGGFGALEVGLKTQDPLSVGKNVIGAVMNPVGYMLDTIQDGVRNSPEWNSEGPEGQPVSGIAERVSNFFNSSTVDQSYRKDSGARYGLGSGNSGSQDRNGVNTSPKPSSDGMSDQVTESANTNADFYAMLLKQLTDFTLDTSTPAENKPYDWSTL